ncbi:MAG: DUF4954 family protein [Bacteroidota bacterium]
MYRKINDAEITILKDRGCSAENWGDIFVDDGFIPETVWRTHFTGKVNLGVFYEFVEIEEGIKKHAGIRNAYIENCTIGDSVYISNVGSLVNYNVEEFAAIENVNTLVVNGETSFGNGTEIEVLNEGGGRELPIFDKLSAQIAYMMVIYRHEKKFIEKLEGLIGEYIETKTSTKGTISKHARVLNTRSLRNVYVGSHAVITGASNLEEGTVASCEEDPTTIGEDVVAKDFIVLSGSKVDSGAIITSSFIGQGVRIGKQYSAEGSAFFANCEGFHGEACSLFAGPYTVTHHKSTLLIAGMFSFYNAGSGTNQSNHMYKLGPLHQGIVERGSKTGSFSYMLWPCRVGAFSVVMDKHGANFDTSDLPFSYINYDKGKSVITPAMNLFTVGTVRDSEKWPKRDRRKDPDKLDLINFEFFNPNIVGGIVKGSELLGRLHESTPQTNKTVPHKGARINRLMLRTSKRYYDLALNVYMGNEVVKKLEQCNNLGNIEEVRSALKPETDSPGSKWLDLFGLIASEESINGLIDEVNSDKVSSVDQTLDALKTIHADYDKNAYAWFAELIEAKMELKLSEITSEQLVQIVTNWEANSIRMKNMILKDAEKEFDQNSKIGFGIDGDEQTRDDDFEAIRGSYDGNSFVKSIRQEIEDLSEKTKVIISKLNS